MVSLPSKLKALRSKSHRHQQSDPSAGELLLKIKILKARDLTAKDRSGKSDPYLILRLNDCKYTTRVITANLNPEWNETCAMSLSSSSDTYRLEAICWDHDKFSKKDYLGEFNVNLKHHFSMHPASKEQSPPRWFPLTSYRNGRKSSIVSGAVELQFWLELPAQTNASEIQLQAAWSQFAKELESHDHAIFALAAPERPVGMHMADEEYGSFSDVDNMTPLPADDDSEVDSGVELDSDLDDVSDSDVVHSSTTAAAPAKTKLSRKERKKLRKMQKQRPFHFKTAKSQDVLGVVFLEIDSASDLPREKNMTKTGFDMDPFVITSFSKKTFRTRVVRHSLNPVFHDKLLLQVHKHEDQYDLKFTVVDRDKISGNDYVGDCNLPIQDLIKFGPQADPETGLYKLSKAPATETSVPIPKRKQLIRRLTRQNTAEGSRSSSPSNSIRRSPALDLESFSTEIQKMDTNSSDNAPEVLESMRLFTLPIDLARKDFWGDKFRPTLQVKAKFVPYPALRQQFWRVILRHYDVDETGDISRVELSTMLDSLGATLTDSTIDSFFKRFEAGSNKAETTQVDHHGNATTALDETLTVDQCVICLEDQLDKLTKSPRGSANSSRAPSISRVNSASRGSARPGIGSTSSTASGVALTSTHSNITNPSTGDLAELSESNQFSESTSETTSDETQTQTEYLISITQCPLCHKSNMDKKSAADIVTHLATCASQDWRKVDHLVMGDFVTPLQAQRKWYTKIISKVGYGGYRLGANSANILVQDRKTGQVQEERMSVYVRLGIRLLYKGMKSSRMESGRIKKMLKSMSIKQGIKYDSPLSAKDIPSFITFHQLNMAEVLDPVESFKSFNEFFYRKLKPGARPCAQPHDPRYAVSPADCRSVVFNSVTDATEIWIKGQSFSIARLFGDAYPDQVKRFEGGALGIFRLAPQDYHRFHIPVDGILGTPKTIEGQYYTVNPMAIRSQLDVYGENIRVLVPLTSDVFGQVMIVCVGAMMVGSTVITAKPGARVSRTDELGYFKFGGSTIIVLFEPGRFVFDGDLLQNAKLSIETLLRVGSSVGHPPGIPDAPNESAEETTKADEDEASRRIAGHVSHPDQSASATTKEHFSTHNAM